MYKLCYTTQTKVIILEDRMKSAFTMIELIFVIVIIGLLAAVAIPKLAATRDDAQNSALIANTRICINDLITNYKGLGNTEDIGSDPACVDARAAGATIQYTNDSVRVSNVHPSLDGDYLFKGSNVSF